MLRREPGSAPRVRQQRRVPSAKPEKDRRCAEFCRAGGNSDCRNLRAVANGPALLVAVISSMRSRQTDMRKRFFTMAKRLPTELIHPARIAALGIVLCTLSVGAT